MTSSWDSLEDTPGGVGSASVNENLEGKPPGVSTQLSAVSASACRVKACSVPSMKGWKQQ